MTETIGQEGVRRSVYRLILSYPGIHLRGVERQLGISSALAHYHLRELSRKGWVRGYSMEGYSRFFPGPRSGRSPLRARDRRWTGLLREPGSLPIALHLLAREEATHGDLVRALGLSKSTVSYHIDKLERAGLVRRRASAIVLRDPGTVRDLLKRHEPTPDLLGRFSRLFEDLYG